MTRPLLNAFAFVTAAIVSMACGDVGGSATSSQGASTASKAGVRVRTTVRHEALSLRNHVGATARVRGDRR